MALPDRLVEVRLLPFTNTATLPVKSRFLPFPVRFTRFPFANVRLLCPCRSATLPVIVTGAAAAPALTFNPCAVVTVPLSAPRVRPLVPLNKTIFPVIVAFDVLPAKFKIWPLVTARALLPFKSAPLPVSVRAPPLVAAMRWPPLKVATLESSNRATLPFVTVPFVPVPFKFSRLTADRLLVPF